MENWKNIEQYKKLYRFIGRRSILNLAAGVLTGVLICAVDIVFAYLLQAFLVVTKVVPSSTGLNFPRWLPTENGLTFLLFMCSVLVGRGFCKWMQGILVGYSHELQRDFQRRRLINWIFASQSVSTAEVFTLYNSSIEGVCGVLVQIQNIAILLSAALLVFLYLLKISFLITVVSIGFLVIIAGIMKLFDSGIKEAAKGATVEIAAMNRGLTASIKNLLLLQIYDTLDKEKKQIGGHLDRGLSHVMGYQKILHLKGILPQTLGSVLICALCVFSIRHSWIPSGLMITYFYLFLQFVQNFSEAIKYFSGVTFAMPAATHFAKWWADHSHDGVRNRFNPDRVESSNVLTSPMGWQFKNVDFAYEGSHKKVLNQFSLTISPKTCTVLIGESGSGKSTLLSLALGLLKPNHGQIVALTEGDANLKPIIELRQAILSGVGYVGPEAFLIDGTILENLSYGLTHPASETDMKKAIEDANCNFIFQLASGLNHPITEQGQGLSAGQKQRLSFARALLRKPKILILDEATSNLDVESEAKFVALLSRLKPEITIIAVTHRDAMLTIADQVVRFSEMA
jgi:ABC-type multidrug transport system fused ATPase/permease subunit